MIKKRSNNPDEKTQINSGYACYIGTKRICWNHTLEGATTDAKQIVQQQRTKDRFVPSITIFDCAQILIVAFVTDDANGVTVHRRNAELVLCDSHGNPV